MVNRQWEFNRRAYFQKNSAFYSRLTIFYCFGIVLAFSMTLLERESPSNEKWSKWKRDKSSPSLAGKTEKSDERGDFPIGEAFVMGIVLNGGWYLLKKIQIVWRIFWDSERKKVENLVGWERIRGGKVAQKVDF